MKTLGLLLLITFNISFLYGQNRDTANISISGYRLHEGTYSWRGTNTYFDRTPSWDTSPYTEGHLRHYNGTYRQNFRLLFPNNYDPDYSPGYPVMLVLHGAGERGNCWYKETGLECYYGDTSYNPNDPPVGATQDEIDNLLNNDHNLAQGAGAHLSARNRAGTMLPHDPALPDRAFPGFVLYPQNLNGWTVSEVRDAIRILRLLMKRHNMDPDRIYISGLSNGGRGVLFALLEADWLFAAAATQSAITDHTAYRNQIDSVVNIPLWMFQGGQDIFPVPAQTEETIRVLNEAGGVGRYTLYPNLGHGTWNTAYAEPDYFTWFTSRNKSDLHVYYGNPNVCGTNNVGAKLSMPQGFDSYEWERNGSIIPNATGYIHVASQPGVYRGRFRRGNEWNNWSKPVNIGVESPDKPVLDQIGSIVLRDLNGKNEAYLQGPEGVTNYRWYKNSRLTNLPNTRTVRIQPGDCSGPCTNNGQYTLVTSGFDDCPSQPSNVKGVFFNDQAPLTIPTPSNFTGALSSPTEVLLRWNDVSSEEDGYEVWRRKSTDNSSTGWTFVTLTNADAIQFLDEGLQSNTTYWYKLRAVSTTARSNYAPGNSKVVEAQNLIISTGTDVTAPSAPTNVVATLSNTDITTKTASIQLQWSSATDDTGIQSYEIRYGGNVVQVAGNQTSRTLNGLPLNQDFNFTVYALDEAGNISPASTPAQASTYIEGFFWHHSTGGFTDIRDVPANVWANPEFTGRSANLTLEPRTQEDYFILRFYGYIYVTEPGNYTFRVRSNDGVEFYLNGQLVARRNGLVNSGCATTNFTAGIPAANLSEGYHTIEVRYFQYTGDKCLSMQWKGPDAGPDQSQFYDVPDTRIRSFDGYTPPVPPEAPEELIATADGMTQINLGWTYSGEDEVEFEIQRALSENGEFQILKRVSVLTYADENLLPGTTYYYRLRSINESGVSEFTPVVNATTGSDTQAPTPPANLVLIGKTMTSAAISWANSTDNTSIEAYEVFANGKLVGTPVENNFLIEGLEPFTTYDVYVVAVDGNENKSEPSNTITFETTEPVVYFSKAKGRLNRLTTWGKNPDGTGEAPSNFTANGLYLYIANRKTASPGGTWTVSGGNSRVVVTNNVTLTVNTTMRATINIEGSGRVIVSHTTTPQFDEVSPTSTVQFNRNAGQIPQAVFGNVTLNGTGSKSLASGETTVMGQLRVSNGLSIRGAAGNGSTILLAQNANFAGSRTAVPANNLVGLKFVGEGPQLLTTSSPMELFSIAARTGSRPTLNTGKATINLTLGSNNGGGLMLEEGSTFVLNSNELVLRGAATINSDAAAKGRLSVKNAVMNITSASNSNSNLYIDSVNNDLYYLRLQLTGNGKMQVHNPVNVLHGLKVVNGELDAAGNVILVSNEEKTANLEEIENNGKISGSIVAQRFLTSKPQMYRYISTPVSGMTIADWQKYFPVTGNFEGSSTGPDLIDAPSLYIYREPRWVPYPTTTNEAPVERGVGYSAYFYRDEAITLSNIGNPFQGLVAFSVYAPTPGNPDSGWNLLGNPYASTIQWSNNTDAWQRSNVSSIVAVRENTSPTTGRFLYYDAATGLGTGEGAVLAGGRIAQGQAFYVQSTGASPLLSITEKAKTTGEQQLYRESAPEVQHLIVRLSRGDVSDAAIVALTEMGSDEFDPTLDGVKMRNAGIFSFSTLSANNHSLAINNMSDAYCSKSIGLKMEGTSPGTYELSIDNLASLSGVGSVTLKDHFAKTTIDLKSRSSYSFEIVDDPASSANSRFELTLERPSVETTVDVTSALSCGEDGMVTLASSQAGAFYTMLNEEGKVIATARGTGGQLDAVIPRNELKAGVNLLTIEAGFKGCKASPLTETVAVQFVEPPVVEAGHASVCAGQSVKLSASAPSAAQFTWYAENGQKLKGVSGSEYEVGPITSETFLSVSATDINGCEGPRKSIVVTPVEMQQPVLSFENDSLFVTTSAERYEWMHEGEVFATTTTPKLPINRNGEYIVSSTSGGCTLTSAGLVLSEPGLAANDALILYPNPTTSENITIQTTLKRELKASITLTDVAGKSLLTQVVDGAALSMGTRVTPKGRLKAGVYFISVDDGKQKRKVRFSIIE